MTLFNRREPLFLAVLFVLVPNVCQIDLVFEIRLTRKLNYIYKRQISYRFFTSFLIQLRKRRGVYNEHEKSLFGCFIGINLLFLSACSSPEDKKTVTQGSATAQTESIVESSAENTTESSTVESNSATVDRAEYSANFSEDWNGLTTNINKVVIVELSDDEIEMQGLENKYAVQVYFEITNNSDMDFDTYPDQATMVVEGQQIEAEMF